MRFLHSRRLLFAPPPPAPASGIMFIRSQLKAVECSRCFFFFFFWSVSFSFFPLHFFLLLLAKNRRDVVAKNRIKKLYIVFFIENIRCKSVYTGKPLVLYIFVAMPRRIDTRMEHCRAIWSTTTGTRKYEQTFELSNFHTPLFVKICLRRMYTE